MNALIKESIKIYLKKYFQIFLYFINFRKFKDFIFEIYFENFISEVIIIYLYNFY
jgi:hypothetical protein